MTDALTYWLNNAGRKQLDKETTHELLVKLSKLEKGSKEYTKTFNRIVEGNLLLVAKTVETLCRQRSSLHWGGEVSLDLLQAGYFGLTVAVERFDVTRKCRLSTIAVPWIRQRCCRWLNNFGNAVYVPESTLRAAYHFKKHGVFADKPNHPKDKARVFQALASINATSLDKKTGSEEDTTLGELLPAPEVKPNELTASDRRILELKEIMAKAGIEPKVQDLMVAYADTGRVQTAANRVNMTPARAGIKIKAAIAQCQAVA
jgi:DNA-directed RNA polymerase sigma subunit (sigma70/sigma32)